MVDTGKVTDKEIGGKELKKLREELWVVLPFLSSPLLFRRQFPLQSGGQHRAMLNGAATALLSGLRLVTSSFQDQDRTI